MTTTTPVLFSGAERERFLALEESVRLSRYGGDCYIYAMLAMGHVDLATDADLKPYDIQGLIPIIEGAGGVITTYDGGTAAMGGTVLAAGSAELHARALSIFGA
jgi:myo-inositol-1(or 4)-monophosphatase